MNLLDNVLMALQNIKANKMRSFLTMLGIIIGIASVIAIETVGNSLSGSITGSLSSFGISNVTVSLTSKDSDSGDVFARMFQRTAYSKDDLISNELIGEYEEVYKDDIEYILLSESVGTVTYSNKGTSAKLNVTGVNAQNRDGNDIEMLTGQFVSDEDGKEHNKYIVVSDQFLNDMSMSLVDSVGKTISLNINNHLQDFVIVGIYKYESDTSLTFSNSSITTTAYIPLDTAKYLNHSEDGFSSFTVVSKSEVDSSEFLNNTQYFFSSAYAVNDSYTVETSNMESMLETLTSMLDTVTLAISAIAAISLLVGGIGVMNIMLVSITERTKEIGTRKALGATQTNIKVQFIVEAVIVCIIGGVFGILLGLALGMGGVKLIGYKAYPDVDAVIISTAISIGIGVFFGYYPANKAAKLNPIDALRYE